MAGGHYFTPPAIATFMARYCSYSDPHMRVLDPGSGTGILSAAVCEAACRSGTVRALHIDAYETDGLLAALSLLMLSFSRDWLAQRGVAMTFDVKHGDFVLEHAEALAAMSRINGGDPSIIKGRTEYSLVISNPPYCEVDPISWTE